MATAADDSDFDGDDVGETAGSAEVTDATGESPVRSTRSEAGAVQPVTGRAPRTAETEEIVGVARNLDSANRPRVASRRWPRPTSTDVREDQPNVTKRTPMLLTLTELPVTLHARGGDAPAETTRNGPNITPGGNATTPV